MARETSSSMLAEYERAIRLSSVATTDSLIPDYPSPSSSAADSDNDNAHARTADRLIVCDKAATSDDGGEDGTSSSWYSEILALKMTVDEEKQELTASSESERLQAATDLYGTTRFPSESEKLVEAMEQELSKIPTERKRAVLRAKAVSPLLFSVPSHAKIFLRAEGNDPKRAAERMVRYWDKRVAFYGDAAFSQATLQKASPFSNAELDYLRHYTRSKEVLADASADDDMRQIAKDFVTVYERFKISKLDDHLEAMPSHERMALDRALRARPDPAGAQGHKLLFLQSCDFDILKAARRMVNYWDTALELFGSDMAFNKRATAASLLEKHSNELTLGTYSLCPGTDASGRVVICVRPLSGLAFRGYTQEGLTKAAWYTFHAALQRKSAHIQDCVLVAVIKSLPCTPADFAVRKKLTKLWLETIPIHVRFVHVCVMASAESWFFFDLVYPFMRRLAGKKVRMRAWLHRGTNEEIATELRNCGLSDKQIPSELGGGASLECYNDWLEDRLENGL